MGTDGSLLDAAGAAELLGRTKKAIRRLKEKGMLPFVKNDGRVFFRRQDLDAFIEAGLDHGAQLGGPRPPDSAILLTQGRASPRRTREVVKVRPYIKGPGWEVEVPVRVDGVLKRKRLKSPHAGKRASRKWGEEQWAELNGHGGEPRAREEVTSSREKRVAGMPTLEEFANLPPDLRTCPTKSLGGFIRKDRLKGTTVRGYRSNLKAQLFPLFGHLRLDQIGSPEFSDLKDELEDYSPKYSNNVSGVLHRVLTVAGELGILDPLKIPSYKPLKLTECAFVVYPPPELARMVAAARELGPRQFAVLVLGADGGLRAGEMAGLYGEDSRGGRLTVARTRDWYERKEGPTKNGKVRTFKQSSLLSEALDGLVRQRGKHVLRRDDGSPCTYRDLRGWFREIQEAADVEPAGVHALRHTFATALLEAGVQPQVVMELGGWANLDMVRRYTKVVDRHTSAGIDALDRLRQDAKREAVLEKSWRSFGETKPPI